MYELSLCHLQYWLFHSSISFWVTKYVHGSLLQLQVKSRDSQWDTENLWNTQESLFVAAYVIEPGVSPSQMGSRLQGVVLNYESWDMSNFSHFLTKKCDSGRANVPPGGYLVDCSPSCENSRLKQPPWVCIGGIMGARAFDGVWWPSEPAFVITTRWNRRSPLRWASLMNDVRFSYLVKLNRRWVNRQVHSQHGAKAKTMRVYRIEMWLSIQWIKNTNKCSLKFQKKRYLNSILKIRKDI